MSIRRRGPVRALFLNRTVRGAGSGRSSLWEKQRAAEPTAKPIRTVAAPPPPAPPPPAAAAAAPPAPPQPASTTEARGAGPLKGAQERATKMSSQNRRQMMQPWPLCLISFGKSKVSPRNYPSSLCSALSAGPATLRLPRAPTSLRCDPLRCHSGSGNFHASPPRETLRSSSPSPPCLSTRAACLSACLSVCLTGLRREGCSASIQPLFIFSRNC